MVFTFDCTGSEMIGMPLNMNDKNKQNKQVVTDCVQCPALIFVVSFLLFFFLVFTFLAAFW